MAYTGNSIDYYFVPKFIFRQVFKGEFPVLNMNSAIAYHDEIILWG